MGDNYLSNLVPEILTSKLFTHDKAALFVTFDEGDNPYPNDQVYSVWAGSGVRNGFDSSIQHSHYSLLKTLETAWKLPSLTSNDASASPMSEFFAIPSHCGNHEDVHGESSSQGKHSNPQTNGHRQREHSEPSVCR